jgi:YD repeat-containing protein
MLFKKIITFVVIWIVVGFCHDFWESAPNLAITTNPEPPHNPNPNTNPTKGADPIDMFSGAFLYQKTDLFIPGHIPLTIRRFYSSQSFYNSPFGFGWTMNYDMKITEFSDGKILLRNHDGYRYMFTPNGNEYTPPAGLNAYLTKTDTNYVFKEKNGTGYMFDTLGYMKSIFDRNGNKVNISYSAQVESIIGYHLYSNFKGVVGRRNLITQISDDFNRSLHFYYDSNGRIDSITGPAGYKLDYSVDEYGNLDSVVENSNCMARSTKYFYNANHGLDSIKNAAGERYLYMEYDDTMRVTKQKYGYNEFEIAFDDGDSITTLTDPRDNNTYYKFNNKMLPAWIANTFDDTTRFEYNSDYKLTKIIGPRDDTTLFSYNFGDLLSVVDALYDTTKLHYTSDFHMLDSIVDPAGHITKFQYDTLGNLTTVINALGKETEYDYDSRGNIVQATDPLGHAVYYSYDPDDGLTHNTSLYGSETYDSLYPTKIWVTVDGRTIAMKFDYDYRRGLRVAAGDPNGNTTYFDYDSLNQLTKVYNSDNTPNSGHTNTPSMRYYYDVKGNMTKKENYYGHYTEFVYDTLNQLREVKEHKGDSTYITKYAYDNNGNLTKFANSAGDTTYYRYDALNRLVKTIYPDSTPSDTTDNPAYAYRYDNPDDPVNLYRRIDANGDTTAYYYDLLNRLDSLVYPNGTAVKYSYNRDYTLHELVDSIGTTSFVYDAAHQLDSIYYPDENYTMKLSYYDNGLRKRETFNKDGTVGYDMFYTYDSLNRLKEVIDSTVDKSIIYTYDINTVSYDTSYGNLVKIAYPNNIVTEYKYLPCCSRIGRIMTRNTSSGDTIQSFEYEYDYAGNRTDLYLMDSSHVAYTYDSLNRLVFTEKNDSTDTQLWSRRYYYDRLGNVTRLISTEDVDTSDYYYYYYTGTNRLKEARGYTYEFDGNGNPTSCDDGRNFYYDHENRMTELTGHGYPTQFYYNGFGDRVVKIEDPGGSKGFYQQLGDRAKKPHKSELYDDLTFANALGDSLHDGTRDLGEVSFDCDKDNLTWEISHKNLIGSKQANDDYERLYITLDVDQIYRKGNLRLPDSMMTKVHPAAAWEYCVYVTNDQDYGYFDETGKKYERPNTMSVRYLNSGANGKIQIKLSSAVLGKVNRVRYTVATTMPGFVNTDRRRNQRSRAIDVYPGGIRTMDNSGEDRRLCVRNGERCAILHGQWGRDSL